MAFFPIEDLMSKVDSRYRLAIIVSKRVRQLNEQAKRPASKYTKLTNIALEEISQGKVAYTTPEDKK